MPSFTQALFDSLKNGGHAIACGFEDGDISYAQFAEKCASIQNFLRGRTSRNIGVLVQNRYETYASLVAVWLSGRAYVPVQAHYPAERNASVFADADIHEILYAGSDAEVEALRMQHPEILFTEVNQLTPAELSYYPANAEQNAYILFTSGTTGKPKGVPINFGNLQAFYEGFHALGYRLGADDRFLQMFELTFDLSVMSFMIPLSMGASFYPLPSGMIRTLGLYHVLESRNITFCLMVPSAIQLLAPYLDDIELPDLKVSQFCGEALKTDMAKKWSKVAPNAVIDNVYGPTEATIYCTIQRIVPTGNEEIGHKGIAGIGKAMKNVVTGVFEGEKPVEAGQYGELCLAGGQVTVGYLNHAAQNEKSFFNYEGLRYYRTGDLVFVNHEGNLMYSGRIDDQVKIQGYRIELAELEHAARQVNADLITVAVGVLDSNENWLLVLFAQDENTDTDHLHEAMRPLLPDYMFPHRVIGIETFPLNSNGKTDRKALREIAIKYI